MENSKEQMVFIIKSSEAEIKAKQIYDAINLKYAPFVRKKSVVLKIINEKFTPSDS